MSRSRRLAATLVVLAVMLSDAPRAAERGEPQARVLSAVEMMMAGAQADRVDVVLHLLSRGVAVDATAKNGFTALIVASGAGSEDVIEALLVKGATVDFANDEGWTALMEAAYRDRPKIVKRLLRAGASPSLRESRQGRSALMIAARGDKLASVVALLDAGAAINARDGKRGWSALHYALASRKENSAQIAGELLVRGADPSRAAGDGTSPLMAAVRSGKLAKLSLVLSEQPDVGATTGDGRTALTEAARLGHAGMVRKLLRAGASIDGDGAVTPLSEALRGEASDVARLLVVEGADVTRTGHRGKTPLTLAVQNGDEAIVALLLEKGAPVNGRNANDGSTALMWAANSGRKRLVERLVEHGADASLAAEDGWTAGEAARMAGHTEIARLLERQI